ncbi:preprotein translocase subunit SecE [bacterium]|nr:preprotein translocase subunit SecE [bacterium]MBU1650640.1 preprotein translocase subunit SecE [bacterium]
MFKKLQNYLRDVQREMSKVSWPTRPELRESTVIVIIISLIMAVYIFTIDTGLTAIIKLVL